MVMSWRHSVHNNADPAIRLVSHSTQFNANEVVFRFFAEVDVDGIKQNNSDMPVQWTYFLWILIHASTVFLHQPTQYYLPCSGNSQQGTCFCSLPWGAGSGLLYLSSLVYHSFLQSFALLWKYFTMWHCLSSLPTFLLLTWPLVVILTTLTLTLSICCYVSTLSWSRIVLFCSKTFQLLIWIFNFSTQSHRPRNDL